MVNLTQDKSTLEKVHLKGLQTLDKSMLEQVQGEEVIVILYPMAWSKRTGGKDCNGNIF